MVPDIAGTGRSFQGAMAYYLHDKAEAADRAHPTTADRVAWTETRNMLDVGPHTATRIMIATAQQADQLKAAAGVKNTGRKSNAHVYAYSLAWHPDEAGKLDKAEMLRAADASLKVLGAEQHQAVIVCHTDQKHPHVHVIVNRVNPENGKMLSTSNDRLKLSDWANQYERERGQILTPKREEKRQIRERFDEARRKEFVAEKQADHRKAAEAANAGAGKPPQRDEGILAPSDLKALSDAQKARHKAEWPALSENHGKAKDAIYSDYGARIKAAAAAHKEAMRPHWGDQFRKERDERRQFDRNERSISGVVRNALHAALHQQAQGQNVGRGLLSATFANVLSSNARSFALAEKQQGQRDQLRGDMKRILDREISVLKEQRGEALQGQREAFSKERVALIERQNGERAKVREAWRQIYERRGAATVQRPTYRRSQWQAERSAVKEHRAQQEQPPRRNIGLTAEQQQRGIERKTRMMEPKPMKAREAFDKARQQQQEQETKRQAAQREQAAQAKQQLTERRFVSAAAPAPSPAGAPPVPARQIQDVPKKPDPSKQVPVAATPAKDWRKISPPKQAQPKPQPAPATRPAWEKLTKEAQQAGRSATKQAAPARKDWSKAAAPAPAKAEQTLASKWETRAKDSAKERPKKDRTRKLDRDFDRER